jgi:hypothetical protein
MVNHFETFINSIQLTDNKSISLAQLPDLLAKVNEVRFSQLLFEWFGFVLDEQQKGWFALDDKELQGTIQTGHKRGEVCVSAVAHQDQ